MCWIREGQGFISYGGEGDEMPLYLAVGDLDRRGSDIKLWMPHVYFEFPPTKPNCSACITPQAKLFSLQLSNSDEHYHFQSNRRGHTTHAYLFSSDHTKF